MILRLVPVNQIDCLEIHLLRTKDQPLAVNLSGDISILPRKVHACALGWDARQWEIPKMTAMVATIAVLRMYLKVMNDGWVRGMGSDTVGGRSDTVAS